MTRTSLLLLCSSALALFACDASDAAPASAESNQTTAAEPPLGAAFLAKAGSLIEANESSQLDAVIGKITRGESSLYRGTIRARDNMGAISGRVDGVIPEGPSIGLIEAVDDGFRLAAFARRGSDWKEAAFFQHSASEAITESSTLWNAPADARGSLGRCTDCLARLSTHPATLTIADLRATGHYFDVPPTPFELTASGSFTKVAPADITYADLTMVRYLGDFLPVGGDMRKTLTGLAASITAGGDCTIDVNYGIDHFIRTAKPSDHGVDNLRYEPRSQRCCGDVRDFACMPLSIATTTTTGTGNVVKLDLATTDATFDVDSTAGSGDAKYAVHLSYADATRYFGTAAAIHAVAIVHTKKEGHEHTVTETPTLVARQVDGHMVYEGDFTFSSNEAVLEVELAFSDAAGHRWDSNLAHNYHVRIGQLVVPSGPPG